MSEGSRVGEGVSAVAVRAVGWVTVVVVHHLSHHHLALTTLPLQLIATAAIIANCNQCHNYCYYHLVTPSTPLLLNKLHY